MTDRIPIHENGNNGNAITMTHLNKHDSERSEAPQSAGSDVKCDNSFEAVLFRRLCFDLRLPEGWTMEVMEKHFRRIVRETLREFPPSVQVDQ